MASRVVIGAAVVVTAAAGGLAYAIYEDVRATDLDIDTEVKSLTMTQRLLDADILDGTTDLSIYSVVVERGDGVVAGLRSEHPIGSFIRADEIRRIEDRYVAMRRNYEQYHRAN